MIVALALLLSAAARIELIPAEVYDIQPHDWQWTPVTLKQKTAFLEANYRVTAGSQKVRLVVMRRGDVERRLRRRSYETLTATDAGRTGTLDFAVPDPGEYAVVVENQDTDNHPARVRLNVWLEFPTVTELSSTRRLMVVLISSMVFFGIVAFSVRRLWRITSGRR